MLDASTVVQVATNIQWIVGGFLVGVPTLAIGLNYIKPKKDKLAEDELTKKDIVVNKKINRNW